MRDIRGLSPLEIQLPPVDALAAAVWYGFLVEVTPHTYHANNTAPIVQSPNPGESK